MNLLLKNLIRRKGVGYSKPLFRYDCSLELFVNDLVVNKDCYVT